MSELALSIIRSTVQDILINARYHHWTLQGLGMLRLYLPGKDNLRLHVWDDRFARPDASRLHTHPWDFESLIVSGQMSNTRYKEVDVIESPTHKKQMIQCGPGGSMMDTSTEVSLIKGSWDYLTEGAIYKQRADEIHDTVAKNGTVTIIKRTVPPGAHPDHAYVYFEYGKEWLSAEPRPATLDEITKITENALVRWF